MPLLAASMPPWCQEGGYNAWVARLKNPELRARVKREMTTPADDWENFFLATGSPEKILLVGFKSEALKKYTGMTLAKVAGLRGEAVLREGIPHRAPSRAGARPTERTADLPVRVGRSGYRGSNAGMGRLES